jgi:hypothetical protein
MEHNHKIINCPQCDGSGCYYCDQVGQVVEYSPRTLEQQHNVVRHGLKTHNTIITHTPSGRIASGRIIDGRQS